MRLTKTLAILLVATVLSSCSLFRPDRVVMHPDAPVLILEVRGHYAKVAAYDSINNRMVEVPGWIDLRDQKGRTLHTFNWTRLIEERGGGGMRDD